MPGITPHFRSRNEDRKERHGTDMQLHFLGHVIMRKGLCEWRTVKRVCERNSGILFLSLFDAFSKGLVRNRDLKRTKKTMFQDWRAHTGPAMYKHEAPKRHARMSEGKPMTSQRLTKKSRTYKNCNFTFTFLLLIYIQTVKIITNLLL